MEPLSPCVSAFKLLHPQGTWGPCLPPPFLPPPLCCLVSLLPSWAPWPLLILLGEAGSLPCALGPRPGKDRYQVPCIEPLSYPAFPGTRVALAWNVLPSRPLSQPRLVRKERVAPSPPPWGLMEPPNLPGVGGEETGLLPLGKGAEVHPAGLCSSASPGRGLFRHRPSHLLTSALTPQKSWDLVLPALSEHRQDPSWCHINMYMCI